MPARQKTSIVMSWRCLHDKKGAGKVEFFKNRRTPKSLNNKHAASKIYKALIDVSPEQIELWSSISKKSEQIYKPFSDQSFLFGNESWFSELKLVEQQTELNDMMFIKLHINRSIKWENESQYANDDKLKIRI